MEIQRFPRHLFHEVNALHRHSRIPEKQDVETGDEHVIGVMAVELRGLVRPTQSPKRPQRRRKPSVQNIWITRQFYTGARQRLRSILSFGDIAFAIGVEPCRYLVAPP